MPKPKLPNSSERAILRSLKIFLDVHKPLGVPSFDQKEAIRVAGARSLAILCLTNLQREYADAKALVDRECPDPFPPSPSERRHLLPALEA